MTVRDLIDILNQIPDDYTVTIGSLDSNGLNVEEISVASGNKVFTPNGQTYNEVGSVKLTNPKFLSRF